MTNNKIYKAIKYLADAIDCHRQYAHDCIDDAYYANTINKILSEPTLPENWGKVNINGKLVDFDDVDKIVSNFSVKNNPLELKPYELNIIRQSLKYCQHRLREHSCPEFPCGLVKAKITVRDIDKLLNKI